MEHERADYNERIQDSKGLIPKKEPVFLIRGQDQVARDTLLAYAAYNERAGGSKAVSDRVRAHAEVMDKWPVKKLADAPEDEKPKAPDNQKPKPKKNKGDTE